MFDDTYKTILTRSEGLFKDRGSRFIGLAFPVKSEEKVKEILAEIKKEYHDATHHCYAYYIGHIGTPAIRMNDDGEPSGTAGKPIYGQILSFDLKNILILVIRYFGGTKLGVSGLINAYKETAKITIANANIIEYAIKDLYSVEFEYPLMNNVMKILKNNAVEIKNTIYNNNNVIIEFEIIWTKKEEICGQLRNIHGTMQKYIKTV
ncbi:MAG: YigZ family protein [Bacteroidales bacterium]|jgi:uncharacterized YigZ family protein|nr:YigZ family protein [Bacteroidales bacterium]